MGDMLIRGLDDEVIAILTRRAQSQGKPVEEVARDALTASVNEDAAKRRQHLEEIDRIRGMTLPGPPIDAAAIVREMRDSR